MCFCYVGCESVVCCGVIWRQRFSDCFRANPFFFLRRKKNSKRKSCKGDAPLTPAAGRDTTTAWGISGRMGYRSHNADRSERGLLNVLPRTFSLASPPRGSQRGIVPRGSPSKQVLPRIRKLSPLCTPPLSLTAPGLPVPRGVSGGGAALSPSFSLHLCSPE